jgi:D-lactate dehydrogenase (cytochrome)
MTLKEALLELVADEARVSTSDSVLEQHAGDLTYHSPRAPDVVVFPETTAEVSRILAWANEHRVPVVPFGAGTSLEGHVIPTAGGITIDLSRMDAVLELRPEDLQARVQPGVLRSALDAATKPNGLWFPVDPGADASLGGMAATNASGTTTVRYGGMRANTLALEVVLADGSVLRPGSAAVKSSAGYDLRALFVGSEGTLGVITELTLRLWGVPEHVVAARATFPSLEAASRTAAGLVGAGVAAQRIELLDAETVRAVNAYKGSDYAEAPSLFLEFAGGSAESVEGDLAAARELARWEGCDELQEERDPTQRARLWQARHDVLFALLHGSPGKLHKTTDVCVPVSQLAGAIAHARGLARALSLDAAIIAHAGDGNYHVLFMLDPEDPRELEAAERLNAEIVDWALTRGGTCTGEHGIGTGKLRYLEREHRELVPYLQALKAVFDPNGILNPGKAVPGAGWQLPRTPAV